MWEINRSSELFPQRQALLKAEAFFEAAEYLKLMRLKSPESAQLQQCGGVVINLMEGKELFEAAQKRLNLSPQEMQVYISFLAERVGRL